MTQLLPAFMRALSSTHVIQPWGQDNLSLFTRVMIHTPYPVERPVIKEHECWQELGKAMAFMNKSDVADAVQAIGETFKDQTLIDRYEHQVTEYQLLMYEAACKEFEVNNERYSFHMWSEDWRSEAFTLYKRALTAALVRDVSTMSELMVLSIIQKFPNDKAKQHDWIVSFQNAKNTAI